MQVRIEIELTDQQADQLRSSSGVVYHEIIGKVRAEVDGARNPGLADYVKDSTTGPSGQVLAIFGEYAWVEFFGLRSPETRLLSQLILMGEEQS